MAAVTREGIGVSPHIAGFYDAMHRIDRALDSRDQQDFADACEQRDRILQELVAEVETRGLVLFR